MITAWRSPGAGVHREAACPVTESTAPATPPSRGIRLHGGQAADPRGAPASRNAGSGGRAGSDAIPRRRRERRRQSGHVRLGHLREPPQLTPRPLIEGDTQSSHQVTHDLRVGTGRSTCRCRPARHRRRVRPCLGCPEDDHATGMQSRDRASGDAAERSHPWPALLGDPTRIRGCEGRVFARSTSAWRAPSAGSGDPRHVRPARGRGNAQRTPATRSRCRRSVSSRPAMAGSKPRSRSGCSGAAVKSCESTSGPVSTNGSASGTRSRSRCPPCTQAARIDMFTARSVERLADRPGGRKHVRVEPENPLPTRLRHSEVALSRAFRTSRERRCRRRAERSPMCRRCCRCRPRSSRSGPPTAVRAPPRGTLRVRAELRVGTTALTSGPSGGHGRESFTADRTLRRAFPSASPGEEVCHDGQQQPGHGEQMRGQGAHDGDSGVTVASTIHQQVDHRRGSHECSAAENSVRLPIEHERIQDECRHGDADKPQAAHEPRPAPWRRPDQPCPDRISLRPAPPSRAPGSGVRRKDPASCPWQAPASRHPTSVSRLTARAASARRCGP